MNIVTKDISRMVREMIDSDALLQQLVWASKINIKADALRSDEYADDLADAVIDELGRGKMRDMLRAFLSGERGEGVRIFDDAINSAICKVAERRAEESLQDAIDAEVRDREEKLSSLYF